MKISGNRVYSMILGGSLLAFAACSHGPTVQDLPLSTSAADELKILRNEIETAIQDQVNVLSPNNFKKADEAMGKAQVSLDRQKDLADTLHLIAEGHAYIHQATTVAQLSHSNMDEVTIARKDAIAAKAPNTFPNEFNSADDHLRNVTEDLESGNMKSASNKRTELQHEYLGLELLAIKAANLGAVRETIALSINEGAEKYAPRSLAIANKSTIDTDLFITANRHENEKVKIRTQEAQANADHLLKITRESKLNKKVSAEEISLNIEGEKEKVQNKNNLLSATQERLDTQENELGKEKAVSDNLAGQNQKLLAAQAFDKSFDDAKAELGSGDAEVFKRGNTILIRLKALKFSKTPTTLKTSNYPVLAKVQKVMLELGKSTVTVEGHTDATGGKVLNDKLSSDRAEAVKEYFLSKSTMGQFEIKSVGMGSENPVASNKTVKGRAMNRRVDILIVPENSMIQ